MSQPLLALIQLARAPRLRLAIAVGLGAGTVLCGVGLMATAGYLISRAAERPAVLSLMVAIVAVQAFGLSRPVMRYLERLVSHDLALRTLGSVRTKVYERIEPLAPAQLHVYRQGDLLSRMVADVDALQGLYLRGLGPPVVALLAGALSVGATAAFLPAAAVILALGLLVDGLAVPAVSGFVSRRAGRRQAAARGELSAELVELIAGAPEIAVLGAGSDRLARVSAADQTLMGLARRDALATGAGDALGLIVTGATVAGVLALSAHASHDGRLDGVLIALLALLAWAAFEAVAPLADSARSLSATVAAGRRILELTDREPAVREPDNPAPPPGWPFALALEDVSARYPGEPRTVFDGVKLTLDPGERLALIGPSGAGKTTVVNLLLRFLDPEAGRVLIGGRDLRDHRPEDIRRAIAVAGQESHLFTTSIRENVRLARPDATDLDVEGVLRRARTWEWICRLPDGIDTVVGEQGRELSGGQRQRIVLARALLADAPVLVLDEPTAHLDPATATELIRDVFEATSGSTVLLITHRTEGLDLVDRVVALKDGQIVQERDLEAK